MDRVGAGNFSILIWKGSWVEGWEVVGRQVAVPEDCLMKTNDENDDMQPTHLLWSFQSMHTTLLFLSAYIGPLPYSIIRSKQVRNHVRHFISKWHERKKIHETLFLKLRQALIDNWSQIDEIVMFLLWLTWRPNAHTPSQEEDSIRYVANFINIIKRITLSINDAFLPSSCHFFLLRSFVRSKQVRELMKGM